MRSDSYFRNIGIPNAFENCPVSIIQTDGYMRTDSGATLTLLSEVADSA